MSLCSLSIQQNWERERERQRHWSFSFISSNVSLLLWDPVQCLLPLSRQLLSSSSLNLPCIFCSLVLSHLVFYIFHELFSCLGLGNPTTHTSYLFSCTAKSQTLWVQESCHIGISLSCSLTRGHSVTNTWGFLWLLYLWLYLYECAV